MQRSIAAGARLVGTSPSYSNAETILGNLLRESRSRSRLFLATKLSGVTGRQQGLEQFNGALQRLGTDRVELLQVHNLNDWKTQFEFAAPRRIGSQLYEVY